MNKQFIITIQINHPSDEPIPDRWVGMKEGDASYLSLHTISNDLKEFSTLKRATLEVKGC